MVAFAKSWRRFTNDLIVPRIAPVMRETLIKQHQFFELTKPINSVQGSILIAFQFDFVGCPMGELTREAAMAARSQRAGGATSGPPTSSARMLNRAEQPSKLHPFWVRCCSVIEPGPARLRADCLHKAHYFTPQGGALNPLKRRNQPKSLGTGDKFFNLGLKRR
jgi:hypothetical protein